MTIYLDLFIFKNLFFNIVIIFLCGKLLKQKNNLKRYVFSALIGTAYATISILTNDKFLMSSLAKLVSAIVMTFVAYPISNFKMIFSTYLIFIFTASCIGGFAIAMNVNNIFLKQLIVFLFSAILFYIFWKIKNNTFINEKFICKLKINIDDVEINVKAFIDTGNTLKDTASGDSVIFVVEEVLEKKLSPQLMRVLNAEILELEEKYYGKIKMIEYQTISSKSNLIIGIKADSVIVENGDCMIKNEKIIVAPTESKFNDCEAILGMNILEEGYVYGNNNSFENKGKKIME